MISSAHEHPKFLTLVTNPKGQVIFSVLTLLAILLFNSFFYIFSPYDGLGVYQEDTFGEVYEVTPGGPAEIAGIQIGDRILAIDGVWIDPARSEPRYRPWIRTGDIVQYTVERADREIDLPITIGSYFENLVLLGAYLGVQFLSIGLWIIGLLLTLFAPPDDERARMLGLGFLLTGLTAAVGGASGWNAFWGANTIQKVLLTIIAPIQLLAHLIFPMMSFPRYLKVITIAAFSAAGLFSILIMIDDWILKPGGNSIYVMYGIYLRQWVLVIFMLSWLASVTLLFKNRLRSPDADIRRQTGIIIWGMILGLGPFFVLTLLPYLLFGQEYVTGAFTILSLILLPLAYAYVIFQRKLLRVDFIINRIVVWFILILLILMASILVFGVLVALFDLPAQLPVFVALGATLIAIPFTTLSRTVQERVDRVLYGSHYDYLTVTSSLSKQLAQTLDRNRLVELLTQHLPQQMGIQQAALLLSDGVQLVPVGSLIPNKSQDGQMPHPFGDELCQALLKYRAPERFAQLWPLLTSEGSWEEYPWGKVFAPLVFKDDLQGILILGQRLHGDVYSDHDLRIIATVVEQGALAIANVIFFEKQRKLAQQLVRSSEEANKRISADLHDTVLQDLFFIKQGIHKNLASPELLAHLEECIHRLRRTIHAQRPSLLDQGLPLALQGLVDDMQKMAGQNTRISWNSNFDGSSPLNDDQAISIYRIAQEALTNAVKHSQARHVEVRLDQCDHELIRLKVSDDGIGASWRLQNGNLDHNHFGLVLMQERALMIDAKLRINSLPGEGTTIELEVKP